jgi:hypothetical protein
VSRHRDAKWTQLPLSDGFFQGEFVPTQYADLGGVFPAHHTRRIVLRSEAHLLLGNVPCPAVMALVVASFQPLGRTSTEPNGDDTSKHQARCQHSSPRLLLRQDPRS